MIEELSQYQSMCAVSLKLYNGSDQVEGTASGIMIDSRQCIILTHASLLYPMVDKIIPKKLAQLRKKGFLDQSFVQGQLSIEVVLPNTRVSETKDGVVKDKSIQISLLNSSNQEQMEFSRYRGRLLGLFECMSLRTTLERLTPKDSWLFLDDPLVNANETKAQKKTSYTEELYTHLLPCFILIKLLNLSDLERISWSDNFSIRSGTENRQGDLVEICATPFGCLNPEVFLNSRSRGIISNVAGPQGVLIMTDARCIPGSEGGGLFFCDGQKRLLTGIMVASLCWKNNEWVGLSMACAISELIGRLNELLLPDPKHSLTAVTCDSSFHDKMVERMVSHIAYITVGHSWGTGVTIYPGIVLTCSHVLRGSQRSKVQSVRQREEDDNSCEVVYKTPLDKQFDLALIKIPKLVTDTSDSASVQFGRVSEGDVVYVVGHGIFKPELGLSPMVTRGVVSKVVCYNKIPIMMQTTCAVHAGVSGGGVFNVKGYLVGLVVCNSRDTVTGACYPHVNMCIPIETITPAIQSYMESEDSSVLQGLHIKNKHIQDIWRIGIEEDMVGQLSSKL